MAEATGNVLKLPNQSSPATTTTDDEVLGSYAGLTQKGLTLLGGAGLLGTGTVLKVSGTAKKYTAAAKTDVITAGSPDTGTKNVAVGILRKDVDTGSASPAGDILANVVLAGVVKCSKIKFGTGTQGTLADVEEKRALADALAGRYDPVHDYLIF